MNMDIVLLIIAICYPFLFKYLEQYFVQKGKNAAQKEDMCDIQSIKDFVVTYMMQESYYKDARKLL